jgi:hypothetical protein
MLIGGLSMIYGCGFQKAILILPAKVRPRVALRGCTDLLGEVERRFKQGSKAYVNNFWKLLET